MRIDFFFPLKKKKKRAPTACSLKLYLKQVKVLLPWLRRAAWKAARVFSWLHYSRERPGIISLSKKESIDWAYPKANRLSFPWGNNSKLSAAIDQYTVVKKYNKLHLAWLTFELLVVFTLCWKYLLSDNLWVGTRILAIVIYCFCYYLVSMQIYAYRYYLLRKKLLGTLIHINTYFL